MTINKLKIAEGGKLYLDGVQLKNVKHYTLHQSARNMEAELTIELPVMVNPAVSKIGKQEAEHLEQESSYLMVKDPHTKKYELVPAPDSDNSPMQE